jgi:hypothetical protein
MAYNSDFENEDNDFDGYDLAYDYDTNNEYNKCKDYNDPVYTQPVRVGVRAVQSILKNATQSNLSMFHNAGNIGSDFVLPKPSIKDILECTKNTHTYSSCKIKYKSNPKKDFLYRSLKDFFIGIEDSFWIPREQDPLAIIYDIMDIIRKPFIRLYLNPHKIITEGYTLKEIIAQSFATFECVIFPDFTGVVDIVTTKTKFELELAGMLTVTISGHAGVIGAILEDSKFTTIKSSVHLMVNQSYIDQNTIVSNDIFEISKFFGIEAAAQVIIQLLGESEDSEIIANFMTRSGKVMPLGKESIFRYKKGFITDISFERARDSIIKYINGTTDYKTVDLLTSVKSKIWAGKPL